jgi:serine/threonine-protein kinase PknG
VSASRRPRGSSTRTGSDPRSRLGAGLVKIPPVPFRDPADAVLEDPKVAEDRRFCSLCEQPVGRSRDGAPARTTGFCHECGTPFSFAPQLRPGDFVGGQYEVIGCVAHGGMGWIYLARDRRASGRWVVLKGRLSAGDRDATTAALAERRFLAAVEHPKIVKIFNFIEHAGAGYIVMEYVGGRSLSQLLADRRRRSGGEADPLPPADAIAYMLEILPALGYLHGEGLLFCDFKPDNVIQTHDSLTLIDLGGVCRSDDPPATVFGTVGFEAPEIEAAGPSIQSDLFTVARTLAVLCIDFPCYRGTYRYTLPPRDQVELLARHDPLYRLLLKATAPDPDDRFLSAQDMADQLHGVLREVVSEVEGKPVPFTSTLFENAPSGSLDRPDWRVLPSLQVPAEDPGAGFLATIATVDPPALLAHLRAAPKRTLAVDLRLAAALIDSDHLDGAARLLAAIAATDPWEWRVDWYCGIVELARGRPEQACARFTDVYHSVPGELAPKLALALALESAGDVAQAARMYEIVSRTDASATSASLGLARCRLATDDARPRTWT